MGPALKIQLLWDVPPINRVPGVGGQEIQTSQQWLRKAFVMSLAWRHRQNGLHHCGKQETSATGIFRNLRTCGCSHKTAIMEEPYLPPSPALSSAGCFLPALFNTLFSGQLGRFTKNIGMKKCPPPAMALLAPSYGTLGKQNDLWYVYMIDILYLYFRWLFPQRLHLLVT